MGNNVGVGSFNGELTKAKRTRPVCDPKVTNDTFSLDQIKQLSLNEFRLVVEVVINESHQYESMTSMPNALKINHPPTTLEDYADVNNILSSIFDTLTYLVECSNNTHRVELFLPTLEIRTDQNLLSGLYTLLPSVSEGFIVLMRELLEKNQIVRFFPEYAITKSFAAHRFSVFKFNQDEISSIMAELVLRNQVYCGTFNSMMFLTNPTSLHGREFEFLRKHILVEKYPHIIFEAIQNFKSIHNMDKERESWNYAMEKLLKAIPFFPLLLMNNLQELLPQQLAISENNMDVILMMKILGKSTFHWGGDNTCIDGIDQHLAGFMMRHYSKYETITDKNQRKTIILRLTEDSKELQAGHMEEFFEDEYLQAKAQELKEIQPAQEYPKFNWHVTTAELNTKWEIVDTTDVLEKFVDAKFADPLEWLENENFSESCLFNDIQAADVFYRSLFKFQKNANYRVAGIPLYFLQRFLNSSESVRTQLVATGTGQMKNNQQLGCDLFCRSINGMMHYGSLLLYYHNVKSFFAPDQLKRIGKKMKERCKAESVFMDFFRPAIKNVWSETFELFFLEAKKVLTEHIERFPYVFYHVFVKNYLMAKYAKETELQNHIVELFIDTLHNSPGDQLRTIIGSKTGENDDKSGRYPGSFKQQMYVALYVASKDFYTPSEVRPLLVLLHKYPAVRSLYKAMGRGHCTALVGRGGHARAELVKVPEMAIKLVAKYFNNTMYNTISGEIECLLQNQFNPHVVQLYGCIIENGRFAGILMEYCEGGSLDDVIMKEKDYDEEKIVVWTCHAASGLQYLHKNGIIHKDVKPHNMLLDKEHDILKVSDLGISKVTSVSASGTEQASGAVTTDTSSGTDGYRAPEVGQNIRSTAAVDVFGLGRSIWQMIYRQRVLDAEVLQSYDTWPKESKVDVSENIWNTMDEQAENRPTMAVVYEFFAKLAEGYEN